MAAWWIDGRHCGGGGCREGVDGGCGGDGGLRRGGLTERAVGGALGRFGVGAGWIAAGVGICEISLNFSAEQMPLHAAAFFF